MLLGSSDSFTQRQKEIALRFGLPWTTALATSDVITCGLTELFMLPENTFPLVLPCSLLGNDPLFLKKIDRHSRTVLSHFPINVAIF